MSAKTFIKRMSDVLKWEAHPGFCRRSVKIKNTDPNNGSARTIRNVVGTPVKGTYSGATKVLELAYAAEAANVTGIIVGGPDIVDLADDATTTQLYDVLYIGPALIDYNQLKASDPAAAAWTLATIKTALEARSIHELEEPTLTESPDV